MLPKELRREAEELAARKGISLSELIREQLTRITNNNRRRDRRARDPLFANANPSEKDAPADLSENHDDYLYGEAHAKTSK